MVWKLCTLLYSRLEAVLDGFKLGSRASTMLDSLRSLVQNPLSKDMLILVFLVSVMVGWYLVGRR